MPRPVDMPDNLPASKKPDIQHPRGRSQGRATRLRPSSAGETRFAVPASAFIDAALRSRELGVEGRAFREYWHPALHPTINRT
jgi:hypothetical protein